MIVKNEKKVEYILDGDRIIERSTKISIVEVDIDMDAAEESYKALLAQGDIVEAKRLLDYIKTIKTAIRMPLEVQKVAIAKMEKELIAPSFNFIKPPEPEPEPEPEPKPKNEIFPIFPMGEGLGIEPVKEK